VWVEHAIYTSLERRGKSGYHIVARSTGISDAEAQTLAAWCPSHGSLVTDANNRLSINFHRLIPGRFVLSRTCEGPPEYSGRGGRQLYTHAMVLEPRQMERADYQLISLLRAARAQGHLQFHHDPPVSMKPLDLPDLYAARQRGATRRRVGSDGHDFLRIARELGSSRSVRLTVGGDRVRFVEELLGFVPREAIADLSFTTSLRPSKARPFQLSLESPELDRKSSSAG
jgi:hypothetical protein